LHASALAGSIRESDGAAGKTKTMSLYDSIVITGANGMLGHALADALHARELKPVLLPRSKCDLASEDDIRRISDHRPTLLLNCAAHTKVDLCEQEPDLANRINGTAVGQLAALCRELGATLVHVSTDFVFSGRGTEPYKIDEPVAPLSAYGRSKLLGEVELQKNAPENLVDCPHRLGVWPARGELSENHGHGRPRPASRWRW